MKVIYSSLEFPYGLTTISVGIGFQDTRVFGVNNVWCDAHNKRCKTVMGFSRFAVDQGVMAVVQQGAMVEYR